MKSSAGGWVFHEYAPEVVDSSDVCAHTDASVFGAEYRSAALGRSAGGIVRDRDVLTKGSEKYLWNGLLSFTNAGTSGRIPQTD
jgi:hypothetical protein